MSGFGRIKGGLVGCMLAAVDDGFFLKKNMTKLAEGHLQIKLIVPRECTLVLVPPKKYVISVISSWLHQGDVWEMHLQLAKKKAQELMDVEMVGSNPTLAPKDLACVEENKPGATPGNVVREKAGPVKEKTKNKNIGKIRACTKCLRFHNLYIKNK